MKVKNNDLFEGGRDLESVRLRLAHGARENNHNHPFFFQHEWDTRLIERSEQSSGGSKHAVANTYVPFSWGGCST